MNLRRRPRARAETIIPLIDVVFFLLVFFMIVGRMDATAPFEVIPPAANSAAAMPGGGATVSVSAAGELALNGQAMTAPALQQQLATALQANPGLLVRINAHQDAELRRILPLVAELESRGARDVVLVVTTEAP
jgi:biopolymer transport protein ExbD